MNDIELKTLLDDLVKQPHELQWLEFKLYKHDISNERIGQYISALSNGATLDNQSFSYLVLGVKDTEHQIAGTDFTFKGAKEGNQDLELWLRQLLEPKINFEIFEFLYDLHPIIIIRIPSAKGQPTLFKKIPYVRINSNLTDLRSHTDLIRIIYNSQEDWSAQILEKATITDLEPEAIKLARVKFIERRQEKDFSKNIDEWDDRLFLDKAKITINGKVTRTAVILLGKEEASHYLLPSVAQITWRLEGQEKGYEHFGPPLLINTTQVMQRIRNIKYKFFPDNELLSTTVNKYETRTILEAMHNCIAHQDYTFNERIIVVEEPDRLIFTNAGSFYEGNPDDYVVGEKTPSRYRNQFLAQAMVNLGMIDTMGYGIYHMVLAQRDRFFPLPDYDLSKPQKVILQIYGHSIDENYSKLLIEQKDLSLTKVVLLDRVQKKLPIPDKAAAMLKKDKLISGRKPNFYMEASVAATSDDKATYIKNRALDKEYYKKMIVDYIKAFKKANRADIDKLLHNKLSDVLNDKQKRNYIRNLLHSMSKDGIIKNSSRSTRYSVWVLAEEKLTAELDREDEG